MIAAVKTDDHTPIKRPSLTKSSSEWVPSRFELCAVNFAMIGRKCEFSDLSVMNTTSSCIQAG